MFYYLLKELTSYRYLESKRSDEIIDFTIIFNFFEVLSVYSKSCQQIIQFSTSSVISNRILEKVGTFEMQKIESS